MEDDASIEKAKELCLSYLCKRGISSGDFLNYAKALAVLTTGNTSEAVALMPGWEEAVQNLKQKATND